MQTKISTAIESYLGLDKKKALRNATALVVSIQSTAKREVSFLKTQIEVDFSDTKTEMLKLLGYTDYYKQVQNNDQEALIQLLYAFKKGMTDELKAEIVAKGTNPALIEKIVAYAHQLKEADTTQENLKKSTIAISDEAITAFNQIYNEIIGICKIASNYYLNDPLKKSMFTFSNVVATMNAASKTTAEA